MTNSITTRPCIRAAALLTLATLASSPLSHTPSPYGLNGSPYSSAWFEPIGDSGNFRGRGSASRAILTAGGALELLGGSSARLTLVGVDPLAKPSGAKLLPGKTTIYRRRASRLVREVRANFAEVCYRSVYRSIDLIYHTRGGPLESDFIVRPGGDPRTIRMRFEGGQSLRLDSSGGLVAGSPDTGLLLRKPVAYQDRDGVRSEVRAAYEVAGGIAGIGLGAYDSKVDLVIDPAIEIATYVGGARFDAAHAVASDGVNIYLAGETASDDFPVRTGQLRAPRTTQDVYVSKLAGLLNTVLYTTILAGDGNDTARAVHVAAERSIYFTGIARSSNFAVTAQALSTSLKGPEDAFVAKLDAAGQLVYSTLLGGSGSDAGTGIRSDSSGNAYVSGYTASVDFPVTAAAPQRVFRGGFQDGFVSKLNSLGQALVYSTLIGGNGNDLAFGIAVDTSGAAFVAGFTDSTNFPLANAFQATLKGASDAFVAKLSSSGGLWQFSSYFGGSSTDRATAIAIDSAGNSYVAGASMSPDLPGAATGWRPANAGGFDGFIAKFEPSGGATQFVTYLGGQSAEYGQFDCCRGFRSSLGNGVHRVGRFCCAAAFPGLRGGVRRLCDGPFLHRQVGCVLDALGRSWRRSRRGDSFAWSGSGVCSGIHELGDGAAGRFHIANALWRIL